MLLKVFLAFRSSVSPSAVCPGLLRVSHEARRTPCGWIPALEIAAHNFQDLEGFNKNCGRRQSVVAERLADGSRGFQSTDFMEKNRRVATVAFNP